jgi:REP element-mobilizing transposase RayT
MPRGPRLDAPGILHHIIARGIERTKIFLTDADRADFLARLGDLALETETPIYAWCLIPNHFHILIRSGAAPLSTVMRRLLTGYAVHFNRKHRRSGHLFQNRFKSIAVEEEPYFLELLRYIHLNPVRAGLVGDLDALDGYPWTGHAALLGRASNPWQDTEFALAHFGATLQGAREKYRQFVCEGLRQGRRPDLVGGGLRRSLRGWQHLPEVKHGREFWVFDERILGSSEFVLHTLTELPEKRLNVGPEAIQSVLGAVARHCKLAIEEIRSNSHRTSAVRARALVAYLAVRHYGLSATAVAVHLGISRRSVARAFERAQQLGIDSDPELNGLLTQVR